MEEKNEKKLTTKKSRKKIIATSIVGVALVAVLGLQVFASTNGYENIFFMIRDLVTTGKLNGNEEIFSDKEITLSYQSIEIEDGVKIQINKIDVTQGKSNIYVRVDNKKDDDVLLKYVVENANKKEQISTGEEIAKGDNGTNIIKLDYEVSEDSTIILKVFDIYESQDILRTLEIDLTNREIRVLGNIEASKISQIELKKYLDVFSVLSKRKDGESHPYMEIGYTVKQMANKFNYDVSSSEKIVSVAKSIFGENVKDAEILKYWNELKTDDVVGKCLDIKNIDYENGIYTVKYVYIIGSKQELESLNADIENMTQYEATIKLKYNINSQYSKYEIIEKSDAKEIENKNNITIVDENTNNNKQEESNDTENKESVNTNTNIDTNTITNVNEKNDINSNITTENNNSNTSENTVKEEDSNSQEENITLKDIVGTYKMYLTTNKKDPNLKGNYLMTVFWTDTDSYDYSEGYVKITESRGIVVKYPGSQKIYNGSTAATIENGKLNVLLNESPITQITIDSPGQEISFDYKDFVVSAKK